MRNFSMKKFGTPGRAGPGVETEYDGSAGAGEPSGLRCGCAGSTVGASSPASTCALPLKLPWAVLAPACGVAVAVGVGVCIGVGVAVGAGGGGGVAVRAGGGRGGRG